MDRVYKIVPTSAWKAAEVEGVFTGFGIDLNDPFIHLSGASQVSGTLEKFFAGIAGLSVVAIDASKLRDALVWEASDDEVLFPHLYGSLPLSAVVEVFSLSVDDNGKHVLPTELR